MDDPRDDWGWLIFRCSVALMIICLVITACSLIFGVGK